MKIELFIAGNLCLTTFALYNVLFNHHWLAGGGSRDIGRGLPVCRLYVATGGRRTPARRRVSMHRLGIPLMVWRLSAYWQRYRASAGATANVALILLTFGISLAGEYDVGAGAAVSYFGLSADFYVADAVIDEKQQKR